MKGTACIACRQCKARCDAIDGVSGGCSRCRSIRRPCVFDESYKRTSKAKRFQQMASEIRELRQHLQNTPTAKPSQSPTDREGQSNVAITHSASWKWQLPSSSNDITNPTMPLLKAPQPCTEQSSSASNIPDSRIGSITLTASQVSQRFRRFFARYHQYLPFKMNSYSAEAICSGCPLLFCVICSVTSSWKLQSQLSPTIKNMVENTLHSSSSSTETVQALLILCMWPFRVFFLADDPSHLYSGLAVQIGLQLGLHRATQTHSYRHTLERHSAELLEVKTTTWLACSIVNHMQSCSLGMPPSIVMDFHLLKAFENPAVDTTLSQLGRIYHLLMQFDLDIGFHASAPSGLLDAESRLMEMKVYSGQLSRLEVQHLGQMNDTVKISFLYAKVQLASFALLGDMPVSDQLLQIIRNAERDACELIELCHGMDLSVAPAHVGRAMCYCGFVLVRILQSSHTTQKEVLHDKIECAYQALSTSASSQEDVANKSSQELQALPFLEDIKQSPPILSRMGASISFDSLRIYWENMLQAFPEQEMASFDLDGVDWSNLTLETGNAIL